MHLSYFATSVLSSVLFALCIALSIQIFIHFLHHTTLKPFWPSLWEYRFAILLRFLLYLIISAIMWNLKFSLSN